MQQIENAVLSCEPPAGTAFEHLFIEHYPRLVKVLLRLLGDPGRAEEIAADAFCKLYQQAPRQGPEDNPAGWLYRTAMNLGFDALRAHSRRLRREERAGRESLGRGAPSSPLNDLLAEEERTRVRAVIEQMKPVQGQVLLMGSSGFSCKEMAALLGVKPDSLYVLIARAKQQFEQKYVSLYGRTK